MKIFHYDELGSTNDEAKRLLGGGETAVVVVADHQTAGRGATGRWESPASEGLLMSIGMRGASLELRKQNVEGRIGGGLAAVSFRLLQAASLAVYSAIQSLLTKLPPTGGTEGGLLTIKWPNDIMWGDKKLCGTLIENTLKGKQIDACTIGIGLNLKQKTFTKELPHACSLGQVVGEVPDSMQMAEQIADRFVELIGSPTLMEDYRGRLYRREGFHEFREPKGESFEARIVGIEPNGGLRLERRDGQKRTYMFKEIEWVLPVEG